MAYRASATEPRTAWARHLDRVMRDRDWSRVRLFEEVSAELGYSAKSRSAFLRLLDDKEPEPRQAAILSRHFGEPTPEDAPPLPPPALDPYAVIDRLTTVLADLTTELAESRRERIEATAYLHLLERTVGRLGGQAIEGALELPTPRARAGSGR